MVKSSKVSHKAVENQGSSYSVVRVNRGWICIKVYGMTGCQYHLTINNERQADGLTKVTKVWSKNQVASAFSDVFKAVAELHLAVDECLDRDDYMD